MLASESSRAIGACCVALGAWLVVVCASLCLGAVAVPLESLWQHTWLGSAGQSGSGSAFDIILWQVRLPRLLLASLIGVGLSIAGVTWQALLRNPLADPYLIGTSAGAALGAGVAFLSGLAGVYAWSVSALAFSGALAATGLVYRLGMRKESGQSVERLVLAGVAVSSFLGAILALLLAVRTDAASPLYLWLMGSLLGRGWNEVYQMTPPLLLSVLVIFWFAPRLNLLQLGDELAFGLGCDVARTRRNLIVAASLLTASVVAVSGMIGFVGLVVPHLARMLLGPDLRVMMPLAACLGALLLLVADLGARTVFLPAEIPVGVLTALLGAPFFVSLLLRSVR